MNHALIVCFDVADEDCPEFEGWLRSSFLAPSQVRGLGATPTCFRSLRVETLFRTYLPSPSYITFFELLDDPTEIFSSEGFFNWWTEAVRSRFGWVLKQNWVAAKLETGPPPPFDYSRALVTQVHLPPAHQDGWAKWYDEVHIPQSQKVPGFFRAENRRFSSIDVQTPQWHCTARPSSTHFVPICDGADIVKAASLPQYLDLMADTQARWAGTMESATSTICERFQ